MAADGTRHDAGRFSIDDVMERLADPSFARRFRRPPTMRGAGPHVNPVMLAACARDSLYVATWRAHAARCDACRELFVYFGVRVDP